MNNNNNNNIKVIIQDLFKAKDYLIIYIIKLYIINVILCIIK